MQSDTIELLQSCNAGIKMGIDSIEAVLDKVESRPFYALLKTCKDEHIALETKTGEMLTALGAQGEEPSPFAKGMSWFKTNVKTAAQPGDETIADLLTDGCNMGVKTLESDLNAYPAAQSNAKDIAEKLIRLEKNLAEDMTQFL